MNLETTLEIIQKHISDTLGVELIRTYDKRPNGAAFNFNVNSNITRIFISEEFVSFIKQSNDIDNTLKQLDVLVFIKKNFGRNLFLGTNGITIDPMDN